MPLCCSSVCFCIYAHQFCYSFSTRNPARDCKINWGVAGPVFVSGENKNYEKPNLEKLQAEGRSHI